MDKIAKKNEKEQKVTVLYTDVQVIKQFHLSIREYSHLSSMDKKILRYFLMLENYYHEKYYEEKREEEQRKTPPPKQRPPLRK